MRRLTICVVAISGLWIGTAHADELATKKQQADALFEAGRKLLNDQHDPAAACDKFNQAIQLDPDAAGTMLNLGLCNDELKKYKTALYWFRKAQARATETNHPDHERVAREFTTKLAAEVATIKIVFATPPPSDAKVKIDGEIIKPDDYLHVEVDPGHHALDAGAAGRKVVHEEFDVEGHGGQTMTIELVAGDNVVVIDRGAGKRKLGVYVAIGGGVLMVASAALTIYEKGKYCDNFMDTSCGWFGNPKTLKSDPSAASNANHAHNIARYVATPIFAAGLAAIGVGAYIYLTAPSKERLDQTVWAPSVSPDQVGFVVRGGF